jgi:hypothetical protein
MKPARLSFAVLVILFCSLASAQQPGPGAKPPTSDPQKAPRAAAGQGLRQMLGNGRVAGLALLRMPAVQQELKLTDDQKSQITAAVGAIGAPKVKGDKTAVKPGPEQIGEAADTVQKVLNESQQKRLKELTLQFEGPIAILEPETAKQIGLTQAQRASIRDALSSLAPGLKGQKLSADERRAKMQAFRKEVGDKILQLLTDSQRSQWKQMLGAPFNFGSR